MRWLLCIAVLVASASAQAFPALYGTEGPLAYEDPTQVVLMKEQSRVVMTVQPGYRGIAQDLTLVLPVPGRIGLDAVRAVERTVFHRLDEMTAPRVVEYAERDPCRKLMSLHMSPRNEYWLERPDGREKGHILWAHPGWPVAPPSKERPVEKQMDGYEFTLVRPTSLAELRQILRAAKVRIPKDSRTLYQHYLEAGMAFVIARVSPERDLEGNEWVLPAIQIQYDSEALAIPTRLGVQHNRSDESLLVYVVTRWHRQEAVGRSNTVVTADETISLKDVENFRSFYEERFAEASAAPGTLVTEYSGPIFANWPLETLGRSVVMAPIEGLSGRRAHRADFSEWVITRFHARPHRGDGREDLRFEPRPKGKHVAEYTLLTPWDQAIRCTDPKRGSYRREDPRYRVFLDLPRARRERP